MRFFTILLSLLSGQLCPAAEVPPSGGTDLLTSQDQITATVGGQDHAEKVPVAGESFSQAQRITVATATPNQPWSAALSAPLTGGPVKKNDRLLVRYMARCTAGGTGRATAKIQLSSPSYAQVAYSDAAKFGPAWERVNLPLVASADAAQGTGEVTIFLGEKIQTVEIADLRVLNYGPDFDIAKLPRQKVTYDGREVDAPWRKAALARIAKIRMADYGALLVGPDGKPLVNTSVMIDLARHDFGFGSCVTRDLLTREDPDGERYRDIVRRTFSRVVFENDLKPGMFPENEQGRAQLENSLAWLKANGISIRGHYLIQEAVDEWTRSRLGDTEKLKREAIESVRERITFIGDRVIEWDAINHPIAWQGAEMLGQKAPPLDTLGMDVFTEARKLTKLPLCINEDQIFRPGPQQDKTFELLAKLKLDGFRVDGLGNQAHFNSSFLPSPEELLRITQRFTEVVPKQVITEYDVLTNGDDQLAADYLRDSLIACFSHPAYDGFLLWGFWEGSHWIPGAALWRKDWSIKPLGETWEEWVGKRFHTRKTLTTDSAGRVFWRGFRGTYRISSGDRTTLEFRPHSAESPTGVILK